LTSVGEGDVRKRRKRS